MSIPDAPNPFDNPYLAPISTETAQHVPGSWPGIRRLPYFLYTVGITVLYYVGILVTGVLFFIGAAAVTPNSRTGIAAALPFFGLLSIGLFGLAVFGAYLYTGVLRLRNLGNSGWWILLMFAPLFNIYLGVKLLAAPEGYSHHRTLDTPGKLVASAFIVLVLLWMIAAIKFTPV